MTEKSVIVWFCVSIFRVLPKRRTATLKKAAEIGEPQLPEKAAEKREPQLQKK